MPADPSLVTIPLTKRTLPLPFSVSNPDFLASEQRFIYFAPLQTI